MSEKAKRALANWIAWLCLRRCRGCKGQQRRRPAKERRSTNQRQSLVSQRCGEGSASNEWWVLGRDRDAFRVPRSPAKSHTSNIAGLLFCGHPHACVQEAPLRSLHWLDGTHLHGRCLAWHPQRATCMATGCEDGSIKIWEVQGEAGTTCIAGLQGHASPVTCLQWHAEGKVLASGSQDGVLMLWDAETRMCLFSALANGGPLKALAWGGNLLATGGVNGAVHLWHYLPFLPALDKASPQDQLIAACEAGDVEAVCRLLSQGQCSSSQPGCGLAQPRVWPLQAALLSSSSELIHLLVESGADPFAPFGPLGKTPEDMAVSLPFTVDVAEVERARSYDCLAWSPNGLLLILYDEEADAFDVWQQAGGSWAPARTLARDPTGISQARCQQIVCYHQKGNGHTMLACVDQDSTIRLWDLDSQKAECCNMFIPATLKIDKLSEDGKQLRGWVQSDRGQAAAGNPEDNMGQPSREVVCYQCELSTGKLDEGPRLRKDQHLLSWSPDSRWLVWQETVDGKVVTKVRPAFLDFSALFCTVDCGHASMPALP